MIQYILKWKILLKLVTFSFIRADNAARCYLFPLPPSPPRPLSLPPSSSRRSNNWFFCYPFSFLSASAYKWGWIAFVYKKMLDMDSLHVLNCLFLQEMKSVDNYGLVTFVPKLISLQVPNLQGKTNIFGNRCSALWFIGLVYLKLVWKVKNSVAVINGIILLKITSFSLNCGCSMSLSQLLWFIRKVS